MLEAYYDCSCDSHALFDDLEIARDPDYEKHMNQYNLLYLDITGFMADTDLAGMPSYISKEVVEDAVKIFPEYALGDTMKKCLSGIV